MKKLFVLSDDFPDGGGPELLFWVGCAGSFDPRAQKVTKAFAQILQAAQVDFAILGNEEQCTGDPARRAGNEFIFQMLALQNIETLKMHKVKKIVTTCPHCFNVLKNDYPALGGHYEVMHHTQLLARLLHEGKLQIEGGKFDGQVITYHDSCYLGRANDVYEAPRSIINHLDGALVEMTRRGSNGLCCGAGGAQMFKEDEPGKKRINAERTEEALALSPDVIAVNCPFCLTMMTDGLADKDKQEEVMVYDLSELIVRQL